MKEEKLHYSNFNETEKNQFLYIMTTISGMQNLLYFTREDSVSYFNFIESRKKNWKSQYFGTDPLKLVIQLTNDFKKSVLEIFFTKNSEIKEDYIFNGIEDGQVKGNFSLPNLFEHIFEKRKNIDNWIENKQKEMDRPLLSTLVKTFLTDMLVSVKKYDYNQSFFQNEYSQILSIVDKENSIGNSLKFIAVDAIFKKLISHALSIGQYDDTNLLTIFAHFIHPIIHPIFQHKEKDDLKRYLYYGITVLYTIFDDYRDDQRERVNLLFHGATLEVFIKKVQEEQKIEQSMIYALLENLRNVQKKYIKLQELPLQDIWNNIQNIQSGQGYQDEAEKEIFLSLEKERLKKGNLKEVISTKEESSFLRSIYGTNYMKFSNKIYEDITKAKQDILNILRATTKLELQPVVVLQQQPIIPEDIIIEQVGNGGDLGQVEIQHGEAQPKTSQDWKTFAKWGALGTIGVFSVIYLFKKLQLQKWFRK